MNPILRNVLAVVAGIVVGSLVNGFLVNLGGMLLPPPQGADNTSMEALNATMAYFEPVHFLFPWLAHAMGTFAGAFLAAMLAAHKKILIALVVGAFFFLGGLYMVSILPAAPLWFDVLDLALAYFPMAWAGAKLASKVGKK